MYELRVKLPSNKSSLSIFDDSMERFLSCFNIVKKKGFIFAMHEAIINSIQMAEKMDNGEEQQLTVNILVDQTKVIGYVIDNCGGISEEKKKEIKEASFDDVMEVSGRGFLLIQHFVDALECYYGENNSFVIEMSIMRTEETDE